MIQRPQTDDRPDAADPAYPTELSFQQGEVLRILSTDDKWWVAVKIDGTVGRKCCLTLLVLR